MKKIIFLVLAVVFVLSSCTTASDSKSHKCVAMGFDYVDDSYVVTVKSSPIDDNKERQDSFVTSDAKKVTEELLSGKKDIIYKSCEYLVFQSEMPNNKKRELVSALMNRNEFQLKCDVYEAVTATELSQRPNDNERIGDFSTYYRHVMSVNDTE